MEFFDPRRRYLYFWASIGFSVFIAGISIGVTGHGTFYIILSTILVALGSSILFPILVSYSYDRLRERWLGDEVWRLFGELSDAGIARIYKDREMSSSEDNAQTRLAKDFRNLEQGDVRMMGVTLRVFFNPLGPFYHDIEAMLKNADGKVQVQALISSPHSPEVTYRTAIEEPGETTSYKSQTERDSESTVATVRNLARKLGPRIDMRFFMPAPYCTAIIFPHIAYISPNILAPQAPVKLPMILYRPGSHGYKMLESSFNFLWNREDTESAMI